MSDASRCLAAPAATAPKIPGITASIPGIKFSFDVNLCCKFQTPPVGTPGAAIPGFLLMTVTSVLGKFVDEVNAELAKLVIRCPRS